jgi:EmrB/QacA subfamily drug resistance transporter
MIVQTRPEASVRSTPLVLVVAGAALVIVLSATIVTIALPNMATYFHRSQTDMTWAVNAYTLAFGGLLLLGGRSGDLFGRRRMLMVGIGLFGAGSLVAGLATSFELLLAGRAVQGVGAAIASPIALSLITIHFEEGAGRNRAIALYSAISGAGLVFGLLLGGVLTEYLTWRWVLLINVPIGLALIVATFYFVAESPRVRGHIDVVGSLISVAGMGGLVYGLIHAGSNGWYDDETIAVLSLSVAALAGFVLYEAYLATEPIMPIRIFADRNRASAYLLILVAGAAIFGTFYFISFFVQGVLGYSALKSGFALLPAVAVLIASAQLSSMLLTRLTAKTLVVAGTIILTLATLDLSRISADSSYLTEVLPALIALAIGLGAVLVPLTVLVMHAVPARDAGLASAVLNAGQQIGGSIGLAVLASAAATAAAHSAKSVGLALFAKYGLGDHVANFVNLGAVVRSGGTAPAAAQRDAIAVHAINTVQAHADGVGFQTAAIFGGIAIVVAIVGISGRSRESALDHVDGQPAT